jgi:hypothetical protein
LTEISPISYLQLVSANASVAVKAAAHSQAAHVVKVNPPSRRAATPRY